MHRMDPKSTSMRGYSAGGARSLVKEADDDHNMQELSGGIMKGESRKRIERPQNYGFTSALLPADKDGKKGPEAHLSFAGGNRSLPVATVVEDRRHRPYGMTAGEVAQYDDQGQMALLGRDGAYLLSNKGEASLRHVEKEKQERKSGKSGGNGPQQSGGEKKEHDHKGKVNTEVRCKKDRIDFVCGENIVAWIDKASGITYIGGGDTSGMKPVKLADDSAATKLFAK